jgi:alanine-glyoxylate transaminase/serine-glyoxylate transaminase/serine-pyruvate transaminase
MTLKQDNPMQNSVHQSGRHFLQVPGPTPIPERILAAMCRQMIDHRSPQFQELAHRVLSGIRTIFRTKGPVILFLRLARGPWRRHS